MFSGMIKISLVFLMSTLFSLMFGMDSKMVIASSQVAYAMNGEITTNSIEELDSLGELKTADYKRTDITIAKKKKKKKKKRSAGRKRILTGEKSVKSRRGSAKTKLKIKRDLILLKLEGSGILKWNSLLLI
jgi:hypothetical protein